METGFYLLDWTTGSFGALGHIWFTVGRPDALSMGWALHGVKRKASDLTYQQIGGLLLAHYAVRRLFHEAADKVGEDPDEISFIHAVRVMRRRIINPGASPPESQPADIIDEILKRRVVSSRG